MATVVIGGSRRMARLNKVIKSRLENVISGNFAVLIGDANGADRAAQQYFKEKQYDNVTVFCMQGNCRNNVGGWRIEEVVPRKGARGFEYFSTKDRAMIERADYGFMIWDGKSRGTLSNILYLLERGRPVLVYLSSEKRFLQAMDLRRLAERSLGTTSLEKIDHNSRQLQTRAQDRTASFF